MLLDRPQIVEGSVIVNPTIPSGTTDPGQPNVGELFYRTDLAQLRAYDGVIWTVLSTAADLAAHAANFGLHLTAPEDLFLDGINLPTITAADHINTIPANIARLGTAEQTLATHLADDTRHVTALQNTFLDGLNLPSLTADEVNFLDGATSNIQNQLNAASFGFTAHITDDTRHLTPPEDAFLDAVDFSARTPAQRASDLSGLYTHVTDDSRHLTSSENTFLDGITINFAEANRLAGIDAYLSSIGSANVASALANLSSTKLNKAGDTMSGILNMGGQRITGLATPSAATDAVNKDYVDVFVQGMHWVKSVDYATTGPIDLSTNGLTGVDGYVLNTSQRVLVKDQSQPAENGIYTPSSGPWSRVSDYDSIQEINQSAVFISASNGATPGDTNNKASYIQTKTVNNVGTDPLSFAPFSGPVINSAGNGVILGANGNVSVSQGAGLTFQGSVLTTDIYTGSGIMTTTDGATSSTAANAQLALTNVGTAGTYRSVSTDSKGRVTGGTNPTTIAGYGLTDAANTTGTNVSGTWPINITGGAAADTLDVVLSRGSQSGNFITLATSLSGNFFTAYKTGGTYSDTLGAFLAKVDNPNGTINYFYQGVTNGTTTFMVRADGLVTASQFNGSGAGLTGYAPNLATGGNAASATYATSAGSANTANSATTAGSVAWSGVTAKPTRTTWASTESITVVTGQLGWKNYGNNHTIFDASAATSPDGTSIDRTNSQNAWTTATCPTLMGWNGASTYGVRVDSARVADTTTQATFYRVRTDAINQGSYGSISISGNTNGWAGINFSDYSATLMISGSQSGVYRNNNAWDWYFTNGVLTVGTVPGGQVSGNVAGATLASKAQTIALGGGDGTPMTMNYAGQGGQPTYLWGTNDGTNTYVWNPSNFSVNYANTAGSASNVSSISAATGGSYDWTGTNAFISNFNTGSGTNAPLQAVTNNATGAVMSFHRRNNYAINMGLDSDNVFRIGGWSAPANLMQLDMSGNMTLRAGIYATNISSGVTGNYIVQRDGNGYTYGNYFNSTDNSVGSGVSGIMVKAGDNFIRTGTAAAVAAFVGPSITTLGTINTLNGTTPPNGVIRLTPNLHLNSGAGQAVILNWDNGNGGNANNLAMRVGNGSGTDVFTVTYAGNVTATGNVTGYSDARLKKDIEPVHEALSKVERLNGVTFKRIDTGEYGVGLIAQNVQDVMSCAVQENENGMLSVAYGNLVGVLVEAIKELSAEVKSLRAEVEILKDQ